MGMKKDVMFSIREHVLPITHLHSRDMSHEQLELFVRSLSQFFLNFQSKFLSIQGTTSFGQQRWVPVAFIEISQYRLLFGRDAPDIRPDYPAFFDIRYPAGY
jgi:hypothetical protein